MAKSLSDYDRGSSGHALRPGSGATDDLLRRFLSHTGSTTALLEALLGEWILVRVAAQWESHAEKGQRLERDSVLYSAKSGPLVAAHSSLNLSILTKDETRNLRCANEPIGRIFAQEDPQTFYKTDIAVRTVRAGRLPDLLGTGESLFFLKSYRLWHRRRCVGEFTEAVSEGSLHRVFPQATESSW